MASSPVYDGTATISTQQALEDANSKLKAVPHDAPILVTSDKNVLVGACQVRLECCKLRLQSCDLQIERDKLKYQRAVEGFEKEQDIVEKLDDTTLLDFLPLVREKSEYCTIRCDLQSRICAEEKKREKLQAAMEQAIAELRRSKMSASDGDSKEQQQEYRLPLGKSPTQTLEELARSTQLLEEQLAERGGMIAIHEETIKIDAELFFQRSCVIQKQNAKLSDLKQLSSKIPDAKVDLFAEKNDKIASLEREVARRQYDNRVLKSSNDTLESQVDELTQKCERYKRRVERANNSRDNVRDRLNTVKAERDAAEDKVNTILDLNQLIISFREQKQELANFASTLQQQNKQTTSFLEVPPPHDNIVSSGNDDDIPEASVPYLRLEKIKGRMSDIPQSHPPPRNSSPDGQVSKPETPKDPNTNSSVSETSENLLEPDSQLPLDIKTPITRSGTTHKSRCRRITFSPMRDEENIDGFPIFGHIYDGIEGLVVWSAVFSSGAVIISSVFLVGHGMLHGFS